MARRSTLLALAQPPDFQHSGGQKTFTCDDIIKGISLDSELEQFPSTFVLREGCDLSITFRRLHPQGPIEPTLPAAVTSQTVVMAFHVKENPHELLLF